MIKYLFRVLMLLLFMAGDQTGGLMAQQFKVMSYNIRYANPRDSSNYWDFRKDNLASMLKYYEADLCGMQEALIGQIKDLESLLPEYDYVGKGRGDGKEEGEFSPIFYRKDKFILMETNTFWLSLTPDTPSKGWDANLNRVVTWAKFKTVHKKATFYYFNTHFDHLGPMARKESAVLLLKKIKEIAGDARVIITGDFNATPTQEPIKIILDSMDAHRLYDTEFLSATLHFGPFSTFNNFEFKEQEGRHIDYVLLKNHKRIQVLNHATLTNSWNGKFASDHHAVMATLVFKKLKN
ncbi:MAG: endonuclease/exonuclease/phosphatase family protein [Saprospiraceae bacterium]|nr:endonuclease/exonuclease/phosphatase family protein [Saprospiraceae bacterium]